MAQLLDRPVRFAALLLWMTGCACRSEASGEGETDSDSDSSGAFVPEERDGMMRVPAGSFLRGCTEELTDLTAEYGGGECESDPEAWLSLEVPAREITLSEFWIDKYEVTQGDYAECIIAGACTPLTQPDYGIPLPPEVAKLPATGPTWQQAVDYCAYRGKLLPTEAQWEKAARGTDGRRLPWGNTYDWSHCDQANVSPIYDDGTPSDCPDHQDVAEVDAFPGDVSPYGVIGMAGNVAEWCADWLQQDYYAVCPDTDPPGPDGPWDEWPYRIHRGGYYDNGGAGLRLTRRRSDDPDRTSYWRGFRCAAAEPPAG